MALSMTMCKTNLQFVLHTFNIARNTAINFHMHRFVLYLLSKIGEKKYSKLPSCPFIIKIDTKVFFPKSSKQPLRKKINKIIIESKIFELKLSVKVFLDNEGC